MTSRRLLSTGALLAFALLAATAVILTPAPAAARQAAAGKVARVHAPIMKLLNEGRTREALQAIREQLQTGDLSAEERSVLLRLGAEVARDLVRASEYIQYLEAALESGTLNRADEAAARYRLGRLYLDAAEPPEFGRAVDNFRRYLEIADDPGPDVYYHLGRALVKTGNFRDALAHAEKAVALSKTPQENHHRLLLFCLLLQDRQKEAAVLLERMVKLFPDKPEYIEMLKAVRIRRSAD